MRKILIKGRFIFFPLGIAALLAFISYVVMQLWNHLLPDILHVSTISFWQALGIFVLCKILFGFGGGGGGRFKRRWHEHRLEHLKNLSPEEREKFRQKMREYDWCDHWKRGGEKPSFFERPAHDPEEGNKSNNP